MALKTFASGEDATDTNLNAAINDIPTTYPLVICPTESVFGGTSGEPKLLIESYELTPVIGDYIVIACAPYSVSGTSELWFEIEAAGETVTVWNTTFSNGSPAVTPSTVILDLTGLVDPPGDITGTDVTLNFYLSEDARIKNLRIWTGDASALADYGL